MNKISATIVADSVNQQGDRLTSLLITFPRILLSEINTHRMLSKNTSSSRAIPFEKMVKSVEENPFIPIAWQKDHKGMQGSDYKTGNSEIQLCINKWLEARDNAIQSATLLNKNEIVTKQLCNRLLEPFMWTTMLITGSKEGWDNFFKLRLPIYQFTENGTIFKSKKDVLKLGDNTHMKDGKIIVRKDMSDLEWLSYNKGQAEIHMMALAECMWDAINESTPKQLKAGEWHIPFGDSLINHLEEDGKHTDSKIDIAANWLDISSNLDDIPEIDEGGINYDDWLLSQKIKIATARCARTSYTIIGEEGKTANYEADIRLHDILTESGHWSPCEHVARCMTEEEYLSNVKGELGYEEIIRDPGFETAMFYSGSDVSSHATGWCRNFRGWIQYRSMIDNQ